MPRHSERGSADAGRLRDGTAGGAAGCSGLCLETRNGFFDGVTEAGPRRTPFGDTDFEPLLRTLAGKPPQHIVEAVEEAVVAAYQGRSRDDIALLALALRSD